MSDDPTKGISRRRLISGSAAGLTIAAVSNARGSTIIGIPRWMLFDHNNPIVNEAPGLQFFTPEEAIEIDAIVSQLIPSDEYSCNGKEAGCTVFIDRQLAGSYGNASRNYMQAPFQAGTSAQGDQSPLVPRERYRLGIAALNQYCLNKYQQKFSALNSEIRDEVLTALENNKIQLANIDSKMFFDQVLTNTMEGFFADPIYGGNKDMVSWKMIGFPGARYDYRDFLTKTDQKLNLVPISIKGSEAWKAKV
ncbi:gluconate 2-dehydrogenase subunit 3 family protein [Rosenbergiella epipactidis]|uniref:gluconate 2-dehydrogenase subunit 3 family protein n=1 Tax=Rosenbergiella epipactidis TaxID=1544694 RepID=UPI0020261239|nr:gluconate 2-dehydrogenase subunit 3 family protein [Rosenbergiella epipactidis]MCL9666977.1 gluconate 2-dehydrogenase subunit 3 family protein [Rosenbergiella epipactidis]